MLCTFSPGQQTSNKNSISTKIEPTVTSLHMCRFTMKPVNVFRIILFSVITYLFQTISLCIYI